jgi:hypothetical protein
VSSGAEQRVHLQNGHIRSRIGLPSVQVSTPFRQTEGLLMGWIGFLEC